MDVAIVNAGGIGFAMTGPRKHTGTGADAMRLIAELRPRAWRPRPMRLSVTPQRRTTAGAPTYQIVPPPIEMPPQVSAMKIAANTTGAMPLPLRASPFKRAITPRTAATTESPPPRISPMNSGMGMRTRPANAIQKAAQAVGLERRSTGYDMRRL